MTLVFIGSMELWKLLVARKRAKANEESMTNVEASQV
jgi:hypothetical protein